METPDRLELELRDSTPVVVRPLGKTDRAGLAEAYRRLSPAARYHRFWTHTGEVLGEKMLDKLLDQDPQKHLSWAVLDSSREFPGLGVASWWRNPRNPEEAEFSVTVLDDDHGRGVGTLLLAVMWLTAFHAGVNQFVAHALTENRQAAQWMRDCGAVGEWDGYNLIFRWNLEDLDRLPHTPASTALADWLARLAPDFLG